MLRYQPSRPTFSNESGGTRGCATPSPGSQQFWCERSLYLWINRKGTAHQQQRTDQKIKVLVGGRSSRRKKIVSSTHIVQATGKQAAHISRVIYHWIQRGLQISSGNILFLTTFTTTHEEHLADKTWVLKNWSIISTNNVLKNSLPTSE